MPVKRIFFLLVFTCSLWACEKDEEAGALELLRVFAGATEIKLDGTVTEGIPVGQSITLTFSSPLNQAASANSIALKKNGQTVNTTVSFSASSAIVFPAGPLDSNTTYTLELSDQLQGTGGERFVSRNITFKTSLQNLQVVSMEIGGANVSNVPRIMNVPLNATMTINFSLPVSETSLEQAVDLSGPSAPDLQYTLSNENKTVNLTGVLPLKDLSRYTFSLSSSLEGTHGEKFTAYSKTFYTTVSATPKFPEIPDDELLSKVQEHTFKYFWDFAHPSSGMARERNTSGNIITSGGSGFGIMALIVGMERNFITRAEGLERMDRILDFLETADRFHGAWSHWIDGNTGDVVPFSANDNGGDLVETSFLVEGLITFRQYLDPGVVAEQSLINRINTLWQDVDWDWYRREDQNVLYWHWSPTVDWAMNHQIKGWNECLITYVLAAASPTHGIPKNVYDEGWATNGGIANGSVYEGITLPLGFAYGGPLFFTHYSFLGFDPRELSDTYANYWTQNVSHSLINYKYCVRNPKNFVGYGEDCWGLTASDNQTGYAAHSPTNDLGVITPTAALSSFPYTPDESMRALKFFYYKMGDRLWGEYGFYDAFNLTDEWTADSYLAIDQGPIIVMIENHRTGLLWELFMSAPEIQNAKTTLGFSD